MFSLVLKLRVQKMITVNIPGRSKFSSPRAFHRWSRSCCNPFGLSTNWFFVCVLLIRNQVILHISGYNWPWQWRYCPNLASKNIDVNTMPFSNYGWPVLVPSTLGWLWSHCHTKVCVVVLSSPYHRAAMSGDTVDVFSCQLCMPSPPKLACC